MQTPIEVDQKSSLEYYSKGVVTEVMGNGKLKVSPLETLNAQPSGHIVDNTTEFKVSHGTDASASTSSTTLKAESTVEASWCPMGAGNRITPPNVVVNEEVMLLRFANVDKYYWVDWGFSDLRRLETVEYRFGGLKQWSASNADDPDRIARDSSYYLIVDTRDQKVEFGTSAKNEEMTTYKFSLDTKTGALTITDGYENQIKLDSDKGLMTIKTRNEIALESPKRVFIKSPAVKVDGTIYASGDINAGGDLKYGGALLNMASSGPGGSTASIKATEAVERLVASGMDMNNPFLSAMVSQASPSMANTNYAATVDALVAASPAGQLPFGITPSSAQQQVLDRFSSSGLGTSIPQVLNNAQQAASTAAEQLFAEATGAAIGSVTNAVEGVINNGISQVNSVINQGTSLINQATSVVAQGTRLVDQAVGQAGVALNAVEQVPESLRVTFEGSNFA